MNEVSDILSPYSATKLNYTMAAVNTTPSSEHKSGRMEDKILPTSDAPTNVNADWQTDRSVTQCNLYMLESQTHCDVTFVLMPPGSMERVTMAAHKYMLISRSPVFFAMFTGPMAEAANDVKITDISPEAFRVLLRFIYADEAALNEDNVFGVLYASKKYMVRRLSQACVESLQASLSVDNVCTYLDNSFLLEDQEELLQKCTELIQRHSQAVFHSDAFYEMTRESLCRTLAMPKLSIPEVDVFRACDHWASRHCTNRKLSASAGNKRELLGEALHKLHLPSLELPQFSSIVVPSGLLSTEEENLVFRFLIGQKDTVCPPFPTHSRSYVSGRAELLYNKGGFVRHTTSFSSLFQSLPQRSRWSLTLYSDHNLRVSEIGLLGPFKGTISVSQGGLQKLEVTCHAHTQHVKLDETLVLDAGVFILAAESPFSYSGEYFSRSVTNSLPVISCDHYKVTIGVRETSALSFLSYVDFIPTDEIHFIDNYYSEEIGD